MNVEILTTNIPTAYNHRLIVLYRKMEHIAASLTIPAERIVGYHTRSKVTQHGTLRFSRMVVVNITFVECEEIAKVVLRYNTWLDHIEHLISNGTLPI